MKKSLQKGLALNSPGRNYLEGSKFYPCRTIGWYTIGFNFALEESYRCWSQGWFPACSILVCDQIMDIDCFVVNYEKTIDVNAFDPEWLKKNEPGDDQLFFF
tara:strand:+ start:294 stop:599 length:306 start_codon:yes stop_codon:yes gene_type:complete